MNRPAEAQKFKLEKLAEAHRMKTVIEAEAEAEAVRVRGEVTHFLYGNFVMNRRHIQNYINMDYRSKYNFIKPFSAI